MLVNSPLILLSGPGGFGEWFEIASSAGIGAITLKTLTINPKEGNLPPRMAGEDFYLINRIGLENPGVREFLKEIPELPVPMILSLGGDTFEEYIEISKIIEPFKEKFIAIEYNFSCPNVERGGLSMISDRTRWKNLLFEIKRIIKDSFLIAKLGIEGIFIEEACSDIVATDWDGVTLINTVRGLHYENGKEILGGLSGPMLKPIALRTIHEVRKKFPELYIIGSGGVYSTRDVKDFLRAGANVVGIGSSLFKDPSIAQKIEKELTEVFL